MFIDELTPIVKEFVKQPIAFLGGFASGLLRLNLSDDPVKSWLEKESGKTVATSPNNQQNGSGRGPQSISID